MILNKLLYNGFLREEAQGEGEGNGNTAPANAAAQEAESKEVNGMSCAALSPYDFNQEEEPDDKKEETQQESDEDAVPYEIEWQDGFVENEDLREMLKCHARESGLPATAAGQFLASVAVSLRADEEAAFKEADNCLKDDWGADYESNVASAKDFAKKLSTESGVPMEKMGVFASPDGFRVLHALSKSMGEGGLKGGVQAVRTMAPGDEAQSILSDPNHRYYKAIADPAHPQWREATDYYNSLVGISG